MATVQHPATRARVPVLIGVLFTAFVANTGLSLSYATLINTLAEFQAASTRTALLLNVWALSLILFSHRYPDLLRRFGTRICAVVALLASGAAIALLSVPDSFWLWLVAESLQGVAFGLFYVAAETWINGAYEHGVRNRINALYLSVQSLGFATGPVIVNAGQLEPAGFFLLAAMAMCVATIPAGYFLPDDRNVSTGQSPGSIRQFIEVGRQLPWVIMLGILTGALDNSAWSLLTPYLRTAGFSDHLSLFALTVFVWGQVVLLLPLGYLADKLGEGVLLRWLSVFIVLYSLVLTQADGLSADLILVLTFLFGPACFSIYGAALALAGKTVGRVRLPVASASLVTGWCLGGFLGSVTVGSGMDFLDAKAFPVALLLFATGVTLVVTRMIPRRRPCLDAGAATGPNTNALPDPPPRRVA
jgi:MFS family permease